MTNAYKVEHIPADQVEKKINDDCGFTSLPEDYRQFIRDCALSDELEDISRFKPSKERKYFLIHHKGMVEAVLSITMRSGRADISGFARIGRLVRLGNGAIGRAADAAKGWQYLCVIAEHILRGEIAFISLRTVSRGGSHAVTKLKENRSDRFTIHITQGGGLSVKIHRTNTPCGVFCGFG